MKPGRSPEAYEAPLLKNEHDPFKTSSILDTDSTQTQSWDYISPNKNMVKEDTVIPEEQKKFKDNLPTLVDRLENSAISSENEKKKRGRKTKSKYWEALRI